MSTVSGPTERPGQQPAPEQEPTASFGRWMGAMWLYTTLRFALFFLLWAIVWVLGVQTLLAAVIALVLSVPLSYVLLARPREAFAAQIEARVNAQRAAKQKLDRELDPGDDTN